MPFLGRFLARPASHVSERVSCLSGPRCTLTLPLDACPLRPSRRPFTQLSMFFDRLLNEEVYVFPSFFPTELSESENRLICLTGPGSEKPFLSLAASKLIDLHLSGGGCSTQCFPFYTYAEDGTNRRENITDCALEQFRARYHDPSISKWDIFHYIYAVLHHPE